MVGKGADNMWLKQNAPQVVNPHIQENDEIGDSG